jgi:hypothetical protein
MIFGPTFGDEVIAAGLGGLPFSWEPTDRERGVPGRLLLTGSSLTVKTMGIVEVAALAANAESGPPGTAITKIRPGRPRPLRTHRVARLKPFNALSRCPESCTTRADARGRWPACQE